MFGIFMALIGGIGRAGYSISQTLEDDKYREEARRAGRPYYFAHDGERRVSDNHKIARGNYGIIDATTGNYIVDKRELDRQKDREFEEENRVSKQEAIIKGKNTYSWKKRTGDRALDWKYYRRLVSNNLPISADLDRYVNEDKQCKYYLYKEASFNFLYPVRLTSQELEKINKELLERYTYPHLYYQVPDEEWEKIVNDCKKKNIEILVHWINIRPINEIKWMHQYCFKYGIPMGTWEEVEAACWEEHPVKWGKPASESWAFKKWFLDEYDI